MEAQSALEDLKKYLTSLSILVAPNLGDVLQLYISATNRVVSTVLVVECEEASNIYKIQHLVYFVSEVLNDSKVKYFHIIKLAYALLMSSRKLAHYFQAHKIEVLTSSTLGEVFHNRETTGKIAKWAVELRVYDIIFKPRTTIKAQALSDFIAKWTESQIPTELPELEYWMIHIDGSLQLTGTGAGISVTSPRGQQFKYVL